MPEQLFKVGPAIQTAKPSPCSQIGHQIWQVPNDCELKQGRHVNCHVSSPPSCIWLALAPQKQ